MHACVFWFKGPDGGLINQNVLIKNNDNKAKHWISLCLKMWEVEEDAMIVYLSL